MEAVERLVFKNLLTGTRLAVGFGAVFVLTATAIGMGLYELAAVAMEDEGPLTESLAKERLASDWYRVVDSGSQRTLALVVSGDPALEMTFRPAVGSSTELAARLQEQLGAIISSAEEQRCLNDIGAARKAYASLRNDIAESRRQNRTADAAAFVERLKPAIGGYLGALQAMLDLERSVHDRQLRGIRTELTRRSLLLGSLGGMSLLTVIAFCISITKGMARPIGSAGSTAHRIP